MDDHLRHALLTLLERMTENQKTLLETMVRLSRDYDDPDDVIRFEEVLEMAALLKVQVAAMRAHLQGAPRWPDAPRR